MGALAIMVLAFAGYIIMYQLYGKYIGRKIFALSGEANTPSQEFEDGRDYVPKRRLSPKSRSGAKRFSMTK